MDGNHFTGPIADRAAGTIERRWGRQSAAPTWGRGQLKQTEHKRKSPRRAAKLAAGLFILPLTFYMAYTLSPDWGGLAEKAALSAAMLNMPEGAGALLQSRLEKAMVPASPPGEELSPWPAPEPTGAPASARPSPTPPKSTQRPDKLLAPSPAAVAAAIPEKYRGTLLQENLSGVGMGNLLSYGEGKLRNYTQVPDEEVLSIMNQGLNIKLEDSSEPQVLIFHTHCTESYEPYDSENYDIRNTWRDTDNNKNMAAVGDALEETLREAGVGVIHDKTQHDYPSYNGAYERSAETIKSYLQRYPTIKVALDVHRDAILREDNVTVKPVVEINGKKAAQLMIITGAEDGTMNVPEWRENLRFAASLQNAIEQDYPQLTRPIFFCYRKYNMDLTTGSLLFEVGSNANTLEESVYSARLIGSSLARLLTGEAAPPNPG